LCIQSVSCVPTLYKSLPKWPAVCQPHVNYEIEREWWLCWYALYLIFNDQINWIELNNAIVSIRFRDPIYYQCRNIVWTLVGQPMNRHRQVNVNRKYIRTANVALLLLHCPNYHFYTKIKSKNFYQLINLFLQMCL